MAILILILLAGVIIYRPFCKYICPLGAFYALFNRIAIVRMYLNEHDCVHCGKCEQACKMDVPVTRNINHPECIRCGDCARACPRNCIHMGVTKQKKPEAQEE